MRDRNLVAWTTLLFVAGVLPQYLVGSLAIEIREDFRFTDAQLGTAVGVSFLISAVVSPIAGELVERIGVRRGVICTAIIFVGVPIALGAFANSALAIIIAMAVIGLGGGVGSPSYAALFSARVRPARQGSAFGMLSAAPSLAAFGAGLALPLLAEPVGWRVSFVLAGLIAAASLAALTRSDLPSSPPVYEGVLPRKQRRTRSAAAMATSSGLASAAGLGMRSFLVVFAVSAGFSSSFAGLLLAGSGLIAIGSRIGAGILGDRRPGNSLHRAAALMGLSGLGYVLMATGGQAWIIAGAFLAGGIGWGWNAPLSLAVVTQNREAPAAAIGIQMTGFFVGAMIGPLVVGLFAEHGSYTAAWIVCAVWAAAAAGTLLVIRGSEAAGR